MGRRTKLTPDVERIILEHIEGGAFDYIAAQAAGIERRTFTVWLRRGERSAEEPFRSFSYRVREARARARAVAESKVYANQPFNWLRYGPGRERPGKPGWTDSKQVDVTTGGEKLQVSSHFETALKRAYGDDRIEPIPELVSGDGSKSELPEGSDAQLPPG